MRVKQGWSGEVRPNQWAKLDVELDETDLRRLLLAAGLSLDSDLLMTASEAFMLLAAEAESFIYAALVSRHGYPAAEASEKLQANAAIKKRVLDQIRASGA